jgi:hypothetical protein
MATVPRLVGWNPTYSIWSIAMREPSTNDSSFISRRASLDTFSSRLRKVGESDPAPVLFIIIAILAALVLAASGR